MNVRVARASKWLAQLLCVTIFPITGGHAHARATEAGIRHAAVITAELSKLEWGHVLPDYSDVKFHDTHVHYAPPQKSAGLEAGAAFLCGFYDTRQGQTVGFLVIRDRTDNLLIATDEGKGTSTSDGETTEDIRLFYQIMCDPKAGKGFAEVVYSDTDLSDHMQYYPPPGVGPLR